MALVKVADVKLQWSKSPSMDRDRVDVTTNIAGAQNTISLTPDVEELMVEIRANQSGWFRVDTFDSEGRMASSIRYDFSVGNLEDPLPATNLRHTVVGIREVEVPEEPTPSGQVRHKKRDV